MSGDDSYPILQLATTLANTKDLTYNQLLPIVNLCPRLPKSQQIEGFDKKRLARDFLVCFFLSSAKNPMQNYSQLQTNKRAKEKGKQYSQYVDSTKCQESQFFQSYWRDYLFI